VKPSPEAGPADASDGPVAAPRRSGGRGPSLATVVGAVLALWGAYIGSAALSDNSFLTHLATGRLILRDGAIPRVDPYTFTAGGEPWVVQSWLASLGYAAVERAGGIDGVRLLLTAVTVALVVIVWMLTRPTDGLVARFAVAASAVAVGAATWGPRPLMFGLLLLALTLLVVERRITPYVLVVVFWCWVNVHGSFPLGLAALAALAVGARLDGIRRPDELRYLLWAAVGTAAGALNPLGPTLLVFPARLLDRQDLFSYVIEWQSPDFSGASGRVFLVQLVAGIVLLVRVPRWRTAVPLVLFTVAALVASRNIAVASLVLVPGMAIGARGLGSLTGAVRTRVTAVLFAIVCVAGAAVTASALREPAYDLEAFPVDAVAWMGDNGLLGPGQRRMVPDVAGNYLELVLGEDAGVSQDDRVDMFPRGVVEDYVTLLRGRPAWADVLARWDPDSVLWRRTDPLASLLLDDPAYRLGYADDEWVVFVRR
jgi:hypothetical protein